MNQPPHSSLRPHRGVLILVFGILGLVLCFPFGIAAWLMGNGDLNEIRSGRMDPEGEGLTQAGRICGIVATALALLVMLLFFLGLALGVFASIFH
jgi:hypothetical protein